MSEAETPAVLDVRAAFEAAWARTDAIFGAIAPEALLARPIRLRQPFLFYVGHLPAFLWNQVARGVLGRGPMDARLDALFERGIDPLDEKDAPDSAAWPPIEEVVAYRDRVRAALPELVAGFRSLSSHDPLVARGRAWRLVLEHEWMHHETLLYMVAALDLSQTRAPDSWRVTTSPLRATSRATVRVPAGRVRLGADFGEIPFGWDNEHPALTVDVPAFEIDAVPASNADVLEFQKAGGYEDRRWWSDAGWAWREEAGLSRPWTWRERGGDLVVRAPFDEAPFAVARDWPASVSWAEADAFLRWQGKRLPTEAEWHRAAYAAPSGLVGAYPWGDAPFSPERGNAAFSRFAPEPVGARPLGASARGVLDLVGNGWEWTSTPFAGYPGFVPWARTYRGYSRDFFDGKHYVMLGGSFATHEGLLRRSFRNWFQPHYPWVFSKFRGVRA